MTTKPKQLPLERLTPEERSALLETLHSVVSARALAVEERKEAAKAHRERMADMDEEVAAIQGKLEADDVAEGR